MSEETTETVEEMPETVEDAKEKRLKRLSALRREEAKLLREIVCEENPEIKEVIKIIEGKLEVLLNIDEREEKGLTRSQQRKHDSLEKRVVKAKEKFWEAKVKFNELSDEFAKYGGPDHSLVIREARKLALHEFVESVSDNLGLLDGFDLNLEEVIPDAIRYLEESNFEERLLEEDTLIESDSEVDHEG